MTSLIFGGIYLAHKGATGAYRDKQRRKNYERWEGLRDEYDAQKKITRDSRSLDIQRTGTGDFGYDDRPIVSLRDLQEANDARTGWRPQESWDHTVNGPQQMPPQPMGQQQTGSQQISEQAAQPPSLDHSISAASQYWQSRGQLRPQKTGATWDEGLPTPLRVNRQSFEDHDFNPYKPSRSNSIKRDPVDHSNNLKQSRSSSVGNPIPASVTTSDEPVAINPALFEQLTAASAINSPPALFQPIPGPAYHADTIKSPITTAYAIYPEGPLESHVPGGRMAELIERGY